MVANRLGRNACNEAGGAAHILAVRIRTGVQENWRELRAIEEQTELIRAEFDGADVLQSRVRGRLDETKAMLIDLHEQLQ